jgi:hypothetical protein
VNRSAPRSIDQYLQQLREELAGEDPSLPSAAGVLLLTVLMHLARGLGLLHATYAKSLLVAPA